MNTSDDKSAFHSISSMKSNQSEKTNPNELLPISNPFFPPFISLSNDFHSHLALLRPFLSFWQTFPFLRPPELIPPPIRPKISNNNVPIPSTSSLINFFRQSKNSNNEIRKAKNVKKYKCDICLRAFSRSNTLVTHKRIHTGEKPFVCDICDRAFRQPGNLTRHKLIHTATKPYVCEICTKAFNRLSNLQAHQRIHSLITTKENELNLDRKQN